MVEYYPTKHAVHSMLAREISWADILWVLDNPEVTYSNTVTHGMPITSKVVQRGHLYVVVALKADFDHKDTAQLYPMHAILTAGLRQTKQWTNTDVINRKKAQP